MKRALLVGIALLLPQSMAWAATMAPSKIGGSGPIDRPTNHTGAWCFSAWTFCPTTPDAFVADGDSATVVFRVRNWKSGQPGTPLDFHLDQVAVVPRSVYDANLASLAAFAPTPYNCAQPATGQDALDILSLSPGDVAYHTTFNGAIGAEWGFDPAQVSYDATPGLQMFDDPFNPVLAGNGDWISTTGSMALGTGSGPEFVEATLQLSGLTRSVEYVVCYWSRSYFAGELVTCDPGTQDNYEVEVFGEVLECLPDLPAISAPMIRTTAWNPVSRIWSFQVQFENQGIGPATNTNATIGDAPATVGIVDGDAPVGFLGTIPRDAKAWSGDSFTFDLSNHFAGVTVIRFDYSFEDDCGEGSASSSVKLLVAPETYPTATPVAPAAMHLRPAVPNPFNPRTVLPLRLDAARTVELSIVDLRGRLVQVLHEGMLPAGEHRFHWDARDREGRGVAAGVYLARARSGGDQQIQRLVLLK